jgi:hypothetical protein
MSIFYVADFQYVGIKNKLFFFSNLEQFSDASNKNFKTINLNFHRVTHNEEALTESMVALEK